MKRSICFDMLINIKIFTQSRNLSITVVGLIGLYPGDIQAQFGKHALQAGNTSRSLLEILGASYGPLNWVGKQLGDTTHREPWDSRVKD
jgi:hypothetical protein